MMSISKERTPTSLPGLAKGRLSQGHGLIRGGVVVYMDGHDHIYDPRLSLTFWARLWLLACGGPHRQS